MACELQISGSVRSDDHIRAYAEHTAMRDAAFIFQKNVQYADITLQLR
jgi:hypothetical protein